MAVTDIQLGIPTVQPPRQRPRTDTEMLLRLDGYMDSGLTRIELRTILAKLVRCQCGLTMLRGAFNSHRCMPMQPLVIDLTADEDIETDTEEVEV